MASCGALLRALALAFVLFALLAPASANKPENVTRKCDPTKPSAYNCLTSCKPPCRDANCLYKCHYDTTYQFLLLSMTPPEGASVAAFLSNVAKLSLYLEDDVVLRIDPVGIYHGKTKVADYIATFVHPLGLGSRNSIAAVQIVNFVNTGEVAAATVNLQIFVREDPTRRLTNLTLSMFNRFSSVTQKFIQGDWNFLRFPQFQEALSAPRPRVPDATSAAIVQAVCQVDAAVCKPLGYAGYANVSDCVAFMSALPRIAEHGLQGNNQYCRFIHIAYATVEPAVHCPHISRSGGGMCVDQVYDDYYKVFADYTFYGKPPVSNTPSPAGKPSPGHN